MVDQIQLPPVQAFSGGADFSQLANLGNVYRAAQDRRSLADLGQQLSAGTVDYRQAAAPLFAMGNPEAGLRMLGMAEAQRKEQLALQASQEFSRNLSRMMPGAGGRPRAAVDTPDEVAAAPTATPAFPAPLPGQAPTSSAPALTPAPIPAPESTSTDISSRQKTQAAPDLSMAEGPNINHIPMLLQAMQDPRLPDAQKKIAEDLWKRAMDTVKPNEHIQMLQGLSDRPDLLQLELQLRKSQSPTVNMLPGEKAGDEVIGKMFGQVLADHNKAAFAAPAAKNTLDIAERAMTAPGFYSGSNAAAVMAAQKAGVALGILDAKTAAPSELFEKMSNKAVEDAAGGGGGGLGSGISNADRDFIKAATFNLSNTPEGNHNIINTLRLVEDRKVEVARVLNQYAKAHGGRLDLDAAEYLNKWAEAHPLGLEKIWGVNIRPGQPEAGAGQPNATPGPTSVRITGPEDYNKLPPNTKYFDPQGNERTKR